MYIPARDSMTNGRADNFRNSQSEAPIQKCPQCNRYLDKLRAVDGPYIKPWPGDYKICLYCEAILEFNDKLELIFVRKSTLRKIVGTDRIILRKKWSDFLKKNIERMTS